MFADRLKKLRIDKKLSQQHMADFLGITRQGYGKYENSDEKNSSQPDFETLKKLSDFFGVSIDYLILGKESNTSADEMWRDFLDPKKQIFFKDLKDAPEEKIEELIRFWEFIKEKDRNK
jgi:transcriptional regulator with XRE-family HTH domain